MIVMEPIWLLLVLPLAIGFFLTPKPRSTAMNFGAMAAVLMIVAIAGVEIKLQSTRGTVVVVMDQSASVGVKGEAAVKEQLALIEKSRPEGWKLSVVAFAAEAEVVREAEDEESRVVNFKSRLHSNLAGALERVDEMLAPGTRARVVVLSDGIWSGVDPAGSVDQLAARGIAVDFRRVTPLSAYDVAVESLDAPLRVSPGELFRMTAWVKVPVSGKLSFQILRNGQLIGESERDCSAGRNRIEWYDRALTGLNDYQLILKPDATDAVAENNQARALVEVDAAKPVLFLSARGETAFVKALRQSGLQLIWRRPQEVKLTLTELARYSSVILENVSASELGQQAMSNLAAWVETQGGGLLLTGGKHTLGAGGFYHSPLDPILPVSLELRREHRKFSMAVAIVLDRSGSMTATTASGKQKIELAARATADVFDLLTDNDQMGVIAVDSAPHTIVEMNTVTNLTNADRNRMLSINSMGGGIYVYEGLLAGVKMLTDNAEAGARHIILFADAADAEQPGDFITLLGKCRLAGVTVSVIGLGKKTDCDAALLEEIARRGGGNIYFTENAEELPRIFAEDTMLMSRSSFVEEPTSVKMLPQSGMLSPTKWSDFSVGGYNLCYLRPGAVAATRTGDELNAPLVAFWPKGLGRVICYTGEVNGKFTGGFGKYPQAGELLVTMARWANGADRLNQSEFAVTQTLERGAQVVRIHLDPERESLVFNEMPQLNLLSENGAIAEKQTLNFRWDGADRLKLSVPLEDERTLLSTVSITGQGVLPLAPVCLPYSPEFAAEVDGRRTLEQLARRSGGRELTDMTTVWDSLPVYPVRFKLLPWLLSAAVMIFLSGVFVRRTGWQWPKLNWAVLRKKREKQPKRAEVATAARAKAEQPSKSPKPVKKSKIQRQPIPVVAKTAESETSGTLSALGELKRKKRG